MGVGGKGANVLHDSGLVIFKDDTAHRRATCAGEVRAP